MYNKQFNSCSLLDHFTNAIDFYNPIKIDFYSVFNKSEK